MATNFPITWAEIGVSGGKVDGIQSPASFDLTIDALKTGGFISNIAGIPDVVIPPDVIVPVKVTVAGVDPSTITFDGTFALQTGTIEISGTIAIGVSSENPGTCDYEVQVNGSVVFKVLNAKANWVQQPK